MIHSIHMILFLQFSKLAESVDLDVWSPACLPDQVSKFVYFLFQQDHVNKFTKFLFSRA